MEWAAFAGLHVVPEKVGVVDVCFVYPNSFAQHGSVLSIAFGGHAAPESSTVI